LITGASRGLGAALADTGWGLILDARGTDELGNLAALPADTPVTAIAGDISDPRHRRQLATAAAASGDLHALVNNASILGPSPHGTAPAFP
jgi:NAD(P)-dependent dehydrogenase (short-subunit alcohol dehydrogenase family)